MGRVLRVTAVIALLNLIWIGFSYANENAQQSFDDCPAIPFSQGRIFEIRRDGAPTSYVFGTLHSNQPEILELPAAAALALKRSEHIATEVKLGEQSRMKSLKYMLLPNGEDLFEIIGNKRAQKLKQALANYGFPEDFVRRLKPWAVASILALKPEEVRNVGTPVLDEKIQNIASRNGKTHHALESLDEQLGHFSNMSLELELEYLDSALFTPKPLDYYLTLLRETYLQGDIGKIHCITKRTSGAHSKQLESFVMDDLLNDRNHLMVERLGSIMSKGVFVAVGAAHLPGEEGILNLLKRQGYMVRPLPNTPNRP